MSKRSATLRAPGPRRRRLGSLSVSLAVLTGLVACSATSRYEFLSFFFDGVPDPNAPKQGEIMGPQPLGNPLDEERTRQITAQPKVYFHKPFQDRKCHLCHDTRAAGRRSGITARFQGLPKMKVDLDDLCLKCHQVVDREYQHAPAVAGRCADCHHPHQSLYEALRRTRKTADLCWSCHNGETFPTLEKHEAFKDRDCHECHDPHASDDRYYLLKGWDAKEGQKPTSRKPPGIELTQEGKDAAKK